MARFGSSGGGDLMDVDRFKVPVGLKSPQGTFNSVVDNFMLKETIGQGAYGKVKLAVDRFSGQYVAIKIIPRSPQQAVAVKKELTILKAIKHANIIKFISSQEDAQNTYIIMGHSSGGELFDKIEPDVGMSVDLAHFYFRQLISAVKYLHSRGVCHRDIKPENILLDEYGWLQIADFGCASVFRYNGVTKALNEICGSAPYIAPEVVKPPYRAEPIDLWSCGIVLYVMLAGNTPWDEPTVHSEEFVMYQNKVLQRYKPWTTHLDIFPLLTGLLRIDPTERLTIPMVERDAWFERPNRLFDVSRGPDVDQTERLMRELNIKPLRRTGSGYQGGASQSIQTSRVEHIDYFAPDPIGAFSQPTLSLHHTQTMTQPMTPFQPSQSSKIVNDLGVSLTRFFASSPPFAIITRISSTLDMLGHRRETHMSTSKIFITTVDKKSKCPLVGTVQVDVLHKGAGMPTCLVLFRRKRGDPLEFKRLFKDVTRSLHDIIIEEPTIVS